ncbi:DUF4884 domain-containing protein [Xanthomonas phage BUDD]|nr:DUF4884 domain-containing protein [Xanthomonas phage BUDD]
MNRWCRFFATLGLGLAIAGGLSGCEDRKTPESAAWTGNGIEVQKLFTNEGCTVFKFLDEYRYRYYVVCGKGTNQQVIDQQNCGKSCEETSTIHTIKE